jgi:predicted nucleotide-binding protein
VNRTTAGRLVGFINEGKPITSAEDFERWSIYVNSFLATALGPDEADKFNKLGQWDDAWTRRLAIRLGYLDGPAASAEIEPDPAAHGTPQLQPSTPQDPLSSRRVFVVHGHDNEAKEAVARFLSKLGLEPIILHEQTSGGRTIIEKSETHSSGIVFAVVLLTPDDMWVSAESPTNPSKRARQNVILELGFLLGRLGRSGVCALHKDDVELPSDFQGVAYVEMDQAGGWKARVAQELVGAKVPIVLPPVSWTLR